MNTFLKNNWKTILKGIGAVVGIVGGTILSKSVYDEALCEERELGEVVTNNDNQEEEVEF